MKLCRCLPALFLAPLLGAQLPATKLAYENQEQPALLGHLGDPTVGFMSQQWHLHWHPQGRLITAAPRLNAFLPAIHIWTPPTSTQPPVVKGYLNVGGHYWVLSPQGDLLVADIIRSNEPAKNLSYGCFRFADGTCLWEAELAEPEQLIGRAFSSDGTKIAQLTQKNSQRILRLLQTSDGKLLSELILPGQTQFIWQGINPIIAWREGFLLNTPKEMTDAGLWEIQTDPLRLQPVSALQHPLGGTAALELSRDGRWLTLCDRDGYEVLVLQRNRWEPWIQGNATISMMNGDGAIRGAHLSPDSRLLLVHTDQQTRIIDVAAKNVVKELDFGSSDMAFSPDGRVVLVAKHSGLRVLNATSWTWYEYESWQHPCPPIWQQFLPDNRTLISADHNGLMVWDLPSRKPRAILKGGLVDQSELGQPALVDNLSHVVAADGRRFLKWRLPDLTVPVPAQPEVIQGEAAFEDLPGQEVCQPMHTYADRAGRWLITVHQEQLQFRDWKAPSIVKTLASTKSIQFPSESRMGFFHDGTVYISDTESRLLDPSSDRMQDIPHPKDFRASGIMLPKLGAYLVYRQNEAKLIRASDGSVLQSFKSPNRNLQFATRKPNPQSTTEDESRIALALNGLWSSPDHISIWDVASGALLAHQPIPGDKITSLSLSPDGKTVAAGHPNTSISLWDVAKLAPPPADHIPDKKELAKHPTPKRRMVTQSGLPQTPLSDGAHLWHFHDDGSCTVENRLPVFAKMRVGDQGWRVEQASHSKLEGEPPSTFTPSALPYVFMEGSTHDGRLHVSRRFGRYAALSTDRTVFVTDGLTNLGDLVQTIEVHYETTYPKESRGLLTEGPQSVAIPNDGLFSLGGNQYWLAADGAGKAGETLAVMRVKHWTSPVSPALHWNAEDRVLRLSYQLSIPPGETMWLIHALSLAPRLEGGSLLALDHADRGDPGFLASPASLYQAGNFGKPWEIQGLNPDIFPRLNGASVNEAPLRQNDGLGQIWESLPDGGRQGSLGALSLLQPWLNGRPAAHGASRILKSSAFRYEDLLQIPPLLRFSYATDAIRMSRRHHNLDSGLATVWLDFYSNGSDQEQEAMVHYISTFQSPVVAIHDARGNTYTRDNLPPAGSDLGGALAFELEGPQRPSTLIAFHRGDSKLAPTLRWLGPQAIALDFSLKLAPGARAGLLLGACQRPLTAYGSAQEAFGDWLPLLPPPALTSPSPNAPQEPPPAKPEEVLNYEIPAS